MQGVHMRWGFDNSWEAIVIADGASKGFKTKSFVDKMNLEKWRQTTKIHNYAVAYEDASEALKKDATYHFLELHIQEVLTELYPTIHPSL